jgi:hypothetical protein
MLYLFALNTVGVKKEHSLEIYLEKIALHILFCSKKTHSFLKVGSVFFQQGGYTQLSKLSPIHR